MLNIYVNFRVNSLKWLNYTNTTITSYFNATITLCFSTNLMKNNVNWILSVFSGYELLIWEPKRARHVGNLPIEFSYNLPCHLYHPAVISFNSNLIMDNLKKIKDTWKPIIFQKKDNNKGVFPRTRGFHITSITYTITKTATNADIYSTLMFKPRSSTWQIPFQF